MSAKLHSQKKTMTKPYATLEEGEWGAPKLQTAEHQKPHVRMAEKPCKILFFLLARARPHLLAPESWHSAHLAEQGLPPDRQG